MIDGVLSLANSVGDTEAKEILATMIGASTEFSMVGTDGDGLIHVWNRGAIRRFGYNTADVAGLMLWTALLNGSDIDAGLPDVIRKSALREGKWSGLLKLVDARGDARESHVSVIPRRDERGMPNGLMMISRCAVGDYDEPEASDGFFGRRLLEANSNALVTTDTLGVITDCDRRMEDLSSYSRQELIGSLLKNYFSEPTKAEEAIRLSLVGSPGTELEFAL